MLDLEKGIAVGVCRRVTYDPNRLIPLGMLCTKCVAINISLDISNYLLDSGSVMNWVFPMTETVLILGVIQLPFDTADFLSGLQVGSGLLLSSLRNTFVRHSG